MTRGPSLPDLRSFVVRQLPHLAQFHAFQMQSALRHQLQVRFPEIMPVPVHEKDLMPRRHPPPVKMFPDEMLQRPPPANIEPRTVVALAAPIKRPVIENHPAARAPRFHLVSAVGREHRANHPVHLRPRVPRAPVFLKTERRDRAAWARPGRMRNGRRLAHFSPVASDRRPWSKFRFNSSSRARAVLVNWFSPVAVRELTSLAGRHSRFDKSKFRLFPSLNIT